MSKIPQQRKVIYYIGMGMLILGFLLFISVFFRVFSFMDSNTMDYSKAPSFGNSILGMLFMIAGSVVMNIGARGAAGSGVILDPEKARDDLKPYNEAKGEMLNDVIGKIEVIDHLSTLQEPKEVIKIKCRNCGSLNDEDAKFCKSCGMQI